MLIRAESKDTTELFIYLLMQWIYVPAHMYAAGKLWMNIYQQKSTVDKSDVKYFCSVCLYCLHHLSILPLPVKDLKW